MNRERGRANRFPWRRSFAVVDVWDALRFDRPYREGWPAEKAREHIRDQAGKHFDPRVVRAFLMTTGEGRDGDDHGIGRETM